eukprot:jgi/Mesen1/2906/ME000175S02060
MATAAMATAAGAAAVLYYTGWGGRPATVETNSDDGDPSNPAENNLSSRRSYSVPSRPPSTWTEALAMLAETLRFTYSETLGKWPIADLAFGINYVLRRQVKTEATRCLKEMLMTEICYHLSKHTRLTGQDTVDELRCLVRMIIICYSFSKKTLEGFLAETGLKSENVLLREGRAQLLKPAFTAVLDDEARQVLLVVRGTHSMKDTLTAVTGAIVPFHHAVVDASGVRHVVLGYAHCGMVAAARWIAQQAIPCLQRALEERPGWRVKVVGHSLGGGTAALLTFILREREGLGETTCTSFAPAACMTWDLAESGVHCVTSVIHGADLVPTFSAASADDLRAEVTASAWISDLREQMEQMRILRVVMGSATALGTRLSRIGSATYNLSSRASLGLRPVSSGTQSTAPPGKPAHPDAMESRGLASMMMERDDSNCQRIVHRSSCTSTRSSAGTGTSTPLIGDAAHGSAGMRAEALWADPTATLEAAAAAAASTSGRGMGEGARELEEAEGGGRECEGLPRERLRKAARGLRGPGSEDAAALAVLLDAMDGDEDDAEDDEKVADVDEGGEDESGEGCSWQELEAELHRRLEKSPSQNEEEEAVAKEITQEEEEVASQVSSAERSERATEELDDFLRDPRRFFPCGRTVHVMRNLRQDGALPPIESARSEEPPKEGPAGESAAEAWGSGLFTTERSVYGRVRLSRSMVLDHFMPNYKKAMLEVISDLEKEMSVGQDGEDMDASHPTVSDQDEAHSVPGRQQPAATC